VAWANATRRRPADLHVSLAGGEDLAGQIYRQVKEPVLDGRLGRGELLPPSRELARRLTVSRNTVTAAYDRLTGEGFISGRVGAGTYITGSPHPSGRHGAAPAGPLRPRRIWDELPEAPHVTPSWPYDFRTGMPDASATA
jgi:GntR family transcriptional regulator / MocR family aminotransferase